MGKIRVGMVLGVLFMAAGMATADDFDIIALGDVPTEAMTAAKNAFPDTDWTVGASDGVGHYKIVGRDEAKHLVEYFTTADGKEGFFRVEITMTEVPEVVKTALETKVPGFEVSRVQASGIEDGKTTCYRFLGKVGAGSEEEIMVSASGAKVNRKS